MGVLDDIAEMDWIMNRIVEEYVVVASDDGERC